MDMPMQQPQQPMGDQMPQEEMRGNLLDLYNKIRGKKAEWDTTQSVADARLAESKVKALSKFFDAFQKAGIDPSNPEAMRKFFDTLYEQNPDMYEMIVPVIDALLGPADQDSGMESSEPMGQEQAGEVGP